MYMHTYEYICGAPAKGSGRAHGVWAPAGVGGGEGQTYTVRAWKEPARMQRALAEGTGEGRAGSRGDNAGRGWGHKLEGGYSV